MAFRSATQYRRFQEEWRVCGLAFDPYLPKSSDSLEPIDFAGLHDSVCDALWAFRVFLDAEGLTAKSAANVDDLLSVADVPQMGLTVREGLILTILRCALATDRSTLAEQLELLFVEHDIWWTQTIGMSGWAYLLWKPKIEDRRACSGAEASEKERLSRREVESTDADALLIELPPATAPIQICDALTDNEYTIMLALRDARPRRVLLTELESSTSISRGTCGKLLKKLVQRGLADDDPDARNGAAMTPNGEKLLTDRRHALTTP